MDLWRFPSQYHVRPLLHAHSALSAGEGYRSGVLTRGQGQRLLHLSWWGTEAFLKERQA